MRDARARTVTLAIVLTLAAITPILAVVYGEDDRQDIYEAEISRPWWDWAWLSTAALIDMDVIDMSDPTDIGFPSTTLGEHLGLCSEERFYDQPAAGYCSGMVVGPDLILVAGHCMENRECGDYVFVFNYQMADADNLDTVTSDDVFFCEEVFARESVNGNDYAVVRIDRPATGGAGRTPIPIRRGGLVEYDPAVAGVIAVGHPYGIPLKVVGGPNPVGGADAQGSSWLDPWSPTYIDWFSANIDHFGGNSGSTVVSLDQSGQIRQVEGILVRGNTDWVDNGVCLESNVCQETGCEDPYGNGLEEMTRTTRFADMIPDDPFCGDGLCNGPEDALTCPEDCPQDTDYDAQPDQSDNCPLHPNPIQENADGDPAGDDCDCEPSLGEVWGTPGEVMDLSVALDQASGWVSLMWAPPSEPGATGVVFDTLRSDVPFDFDGAATCLKWDAAEPSAEDWDPPPPVGQAVYYVVRAKNGCPAGGTGPAGRDSFDRLRAARMCP